LLLDEFGEKLPAPELLDIAGNLVFSLLRNEKGKAKIICFSLEYL
jgi:hypothetical protein